MKTTYTESLTNYIRWQTREVKVGKIGIGGNNPLRLQSMTNCKPMDTTANAEQAIRIFEAGGEIVRCTAPSSRDAENLANIKAELIAKGFDIPLVADIHFNPQAAMTAAQMVEKVRINPGNFAEKKTDKLEYTEEEYAEALSEIMTKLKPLVDVCKSRGIAMRIGSNHGSLSQRILNRFGDTPLGMVEAAMEYMRMCIQLDYFDLVLSMKASNIRVMVQAYRLLVSKMKEEGMNFPIHLGVTEAGDGEDGRIKSAAGIGTMLEDGIGDTIRVSLTEDPEFEIPVAALISERYDQRKSIRELPEIEHYTIDPYAFNKRETLEVRMFGAKNEPLVVGHDIFWQTKFMHNASKIVPFAEWDKANKKHFPLISFDKFQKEENIESEMIFVEMKQENFTSNWQKYLQNKTNLVLVFETERENTYPSFRRMFVELMNNDIKLPVLIRHNYKDLDEERLLIHAATDFGGLFIDGLGDGMWIETTNQAITQTRLNEISLGILQACRARITKTDYISCPSCGRTMYDIQSTTARIREKTGHLKGLKIAVMGCIVNGPGEMADADYGYVGAGLGKINLYKGKEVISKGVEEARAVDDLIELIKANGDWVEI